MSCHLVLLNIHILCLLPVLHLNLSLGWHYMWRHSRRWLAHADPDPVVTEGALEVGRVLVQNDAEFLDVFLGLWLLLLRFFPLRIKSLVVLIVAVLPCVP